VVAAAIAMIGIRPAYAIGACSPGVKCPKANDDSYQTTIGSPLNVPAPGLLANDLGDGGTSVDVNDSDTTTWLNADVTVHGDGSFAYTPVQAGVDTFNYYIQDDAGHWDLGTVTVTVLAVVRDDTYTTPKDRRLVVKAPGPLANDLGYDINSLNADLTSANGGDVTVNDDGSFEYTPPAGYSGVDTFTYNVMDNDGDNSYTATVSIGVGVPAPPDTKVVAPDTPLPGATGNGLKGSAGATGVPVVGAAGNAAGVGRSTGPGRTGTGTRGNDAAGRASHNRARGVKGNASTTTVAGERISNAAGSSGTGSGKSGDSRDAAGVAHASSSGGSTVGTIVLAVAIAAFVAAIAAGFVWHRRRQHPEPSQEVLS